MKLKVTVEGKVYEVEVEVAEPDITTGVRYVQTGVAPSAPSVNIPAMPSAGHDKVADEGKVCRSPLAGVVSEVHVEVGQEVTADQQLVVLEAMKMFTTITSPVAGKIKSVLVEKTSAVKQGQVLLEFE